MPVFSYPDRASAKAAETPNTYLVETEADVLWGGRILVEVYNLVTGLSVNKFESTEIGKRRLVTQLDRYAKKGLDTSPERLGLSKPKEDGIMATKEERAAAAAAKLAKQQEAEAAKQAKADAKAAKAQEIADAKAAKKAEREAAKAAKAANKSARKPREVKLGAFSQVRESTALGQIAKACFAGGATLDSLAALINKPSDAVTALLKRARVTHGIDHTIEDGTGVVSLVLPAGKTEADLFKVAKPRPEPKGDGAPRHSKNAERDALAASGVMPEKPIVTSPTNMHRQKHFDALAAMADAGEWDKIANFNAVKVHSDSYADMIYRYRDRLLAAHAAQEARQAAE